MKFSAVELAALLNGTIESDASVWVDKLSKIKERYWLPFLKVLQNLAKH